MHEDQGLASLIIVVGQVAAERETLNAHAESLDGKAGVVLGFACVLVGLGATAEVAVSGGVIFHLGLAVIAALLTARALFRRRYPRSSGSQRLEAVRLRVILASTKPHTTESGVPRPGADLFARPRPGCAGEHLKVATVEGADDVEMSMVQAGDRARSYRSAMTTIDASATPIPWSW